MDRQALIGRLAENGIVPCVPHGKYVYVDPAASTCPVCGGYDSVSGIWDPEMALEYAALADELLVAAGGRAFEQLDRGPCICGHRHSWEFVRTVGVCLRVYRCVVEGCGSTNIVDSSD